MGNEANTVDILIRTILDATGGDLTIRQQKDLRKALEETQKGGELTVRQFKLIEDAATKMGGAAADAMAKLKPSGGYGANFVDPKTLAQPSGYAAAIGPGLSDVFTKAGREAGEKMGHEAGEAFGKGFKPQIAHVLSVVGQQFGLNGLGTAFLSGGVVGSGIVLGLSLIHKAIEGMSEDDKVLEEISEGLKEIEKHSGPGKGASLTSDDLKKLAGVMAGDAKAASKAWTDAMAGNFTALRSLGIITTDTKTRTQQLGEALQTLRTDGGSDLYDLATAATNAAAEIDAIKTAAENAQKAIEKTSAAIDRAAAARERAAGNEQGADIAEIEARGAEGGISRAEADKKIASIKQVGLARSHINAQDDRRQKIGAANSGIEDIQSTFAEQAADTQERERIIGLLSELQRRSAATKQIQEQIDAIVTASFGPGKTEEEYKKFLGTLNPGQSADMLGTLGGLDKQLAQAKAGEGAIRSQLPPGRDNLDAERLWMNENTAIKTPGVPPKLVAAQIEAYKRLIELMEKVKLLESEMRQADQEFGQKIRQGNAEGRAKDATNTRQEEERSQRENRKGTEERMRELERYQRGGGDRGAASSFDGAGIVAAIDQSTGNLEGMGKAILSALERQNRTIKTLNDDIARVDSNVGMMA